MVPLVALSTIGPVAATAIVPELSGTLIVLVLEAVILPRSKTAFLVLSAPFWKVVDESVSVLLVKV